MHKIRLIYKSKYEEAEKQNLIIIQELISRSSPNLR